LLWKKKPKNRAPLVIKKLPQKQSPNRQKFAQFGHPGSRNRLLNVLLHCFAAAIFGPGNGKFLAKGKNGSSKPSFQNQVKKFHAGKNVPCRARFFCPECRDKERQVNTFFTSVKLSASYPHKKLLFGIN
jgi:hypothetical protein